MTNNRERNALEALHDIEEQIAATQWTIDERVFSSGEYEGQQATLELEYLPQSDRIIADDEDGQQTIKTLVEDIASKHSKGAPIDEVVTRAVDELNIDPTAAHDKLEQLRQQGRVYTPHADRVRVT